MIHAEKKIFRGVMPAGGVTVKTTPDQEISHTVNLAKSTFFNILELKVFAL
jgi:hypothetical protein